MKYDIYFHNDFDGRASAAVMLNFLRGRGDEIEHFVPVNFDLESQWLKDSFFEKHRLFRGRRNPAIIVDFFYHPKAAFWFDHHATTFKRRDWRKKFKPDKFHNLNPEYKSCCRQVLDCLKKHFAFRPPPHLKELAKWLDIVDGALYKSAAEVLLLKQVAFRAALFSDETSGDIRTTRWLIDFLSKNRVGRLARERKFRLLMRRILGNVKIGLDFYKKNLKIHNRLAFIDLSPGPLVHYENLRFASFYLFPKLFYSLRLYKRGENYHISLGFNPWLPKRLNKTNVGSFLEKKFGGGGHEAVGGVEFGGRAAADRAVRKIIKHFQ